MGVRGLRSGDNIGYSEHHDANESDDGSEMRPYAGGSDGVINRLGTQQSRWKRQVQEQRRNIFDRHAMLN